jgi:hypothetical protein
MNMATTNPRLREDLETAIGHRLTETAWAAIVNEPAPLLRDKFQHVADDGKGCVERYELKSNAAVVAIYPQTISDEFVVIQWYDGADFDTTDHPTLIAAMLAAAALDTSGEDA